MGNACCGEAEPEARNPKTISGSPPPRKVMTPTEDERREQARIAAEERLRKDAVRGTQRYHPKPPAPKYDNRDNYTSSRNSGPDISDWT